MTGTNHLITGALIGSVVATPVIAIPLALASHFVLDALPHYGDKSISQDSQRFHSIIIVDMALSSLFILIVLLWRPAHWPVMLAAGFLAMSPDLMWLPNYIRTIRKKTIRSYNKVMRWHEKIQREHVWGYVIEAAWFVLLVPVFCLTIDRF